MPGVIYQQAIPSAIDDFRLYNHENIAYSLSHLMGERGILLGFSGDIWSLDSMRHVRWLQKRSYKLALRDIGAAIIVPTETYEISGFYMSNPNPIPFPLLADPERRVYDLFGLEAGFVLLDAQRHMRKSWSLRKGHTPSLREITSYAAP